jgi:hypothetical protein
MPDFPLFCVATKFCASVIVVANNKKKQFRASVIVVANKANLQVSTYLLILYLAEKILKFENCSVLKYRFGCEVTTVIQRCGTGFKCCRKDFRNLQFFPQNGVKVVQTVDFANLFNNFEPFKKLKIGLFFVFEIVILYFVQIFGDGTHKISHPSSWIWHQHFSVLLRTLKICEVLLVHPVWGMASSAWNATVKMVMVLNNLSQAV